MRIHSHSSILKASKPYKDSHKSLDVVVVVIVGFVVDVVV